MNRAQINRAEAVAEQLTNRKRVMEVRVVEARQSILDELETAEEEKAALFARRRVYVEQVQRFERYRQEVFAFLMAEGVVPDDDGLRAAEAVPDRDRLAEFTRRQMELGAFLVSH
jgi:hypothetical protein